MTPRERFELTGQIYFGMSSRPSRNARTFYDLARKHRLSEPLGRAIYARRARSTTADSAADSRRCEPAASRRLADGSSTGSEVDR